MIPPRKHYSLVFTLRWRMDSIHRISGIELSRTTEGECKTTVPPQSLKGLSQITHDYRGGKVTQTIFFGLALETSKIQLLDHCAIPSGYPQPAVTFTSFFTAGNNRCNGRKRGKAPLLLAFPISVPPDESA